MRPENLKIRLAVLGILAALTVGLCGAAAADEPTDFADALARTAQQNTILVLDFYTDW